jgi:hypothetical protein
MKNAFVAKGICMELSLVSSINLALLIAQVLCSVVKYTRKAKIKHAFNKNLGFNPYL